MDRRNAMMAAALYGGAPRLPEETNRRMLELMFGAGTGMLPGSGIADALGQLPDSGGVKAPSLMDNLRRKEYLSAALQGAGVLGDFAQAFPPSMMAGTALKAALIGATMNKGSDAMAGIRGYHASPYDFDKFDKAHIGSGEGAQAFGHGLYIAGIEPTAKTYLPSGWKGEYKLGGRDVSDIYNEASSKMDYDKAAVLERVLLHQSRDQIAKYFTDEGSPGALKYLRTLPDDLFAPAGGKMYEVNIKATPDEFVDWDAPMSKQPDGVKNMMRDELKRLGYLGPKDNGPRQLMAAVDAWKMEHGGMSDTPVRTMLFGGGKIAGGTPEGVADQLLKYGIKGVKYLDQGSRAAGKGSRNYVVFDDKTIDIIRKYGLVPGMLGLGAAGTMFAGDDDA